MSLQEIIVWGLLVAGTAASLAACVAMLVFRRFYGRLHYVGLASVPGIVAIAAAVVVDSGATGATTKAIITAVVIAISSPVLSHATARAARIREFGYWSALPAAEKGADEAEPVAEAGE